MKVFRFMSYTELKKFLDGEILTNNKIHEGRTNSVGFCFLDYEENTPDYAYEYLSGIVSNEFCVVFETNKKMKKGYGIYASPYGGFFSTITKEEYSTTQYDQNTFKILKVAIVKEKGYEDDFEWFENIKEALQVYAKVKEEEEKDRKEYKKCEELEEQYEVKQGKKLNDFINKINSGNLLEMKIGDEYYRVRAVINEIEYSYNDVITLKIEALI